jgi:hypothetical protein
MPSSSSSESTWEDWREQVLGWLDDLKDNVTLPALVNAGAGAAADAFDAGIYNDTGSHFSSSDKEAIKNGIASTAMSLLTGAVDDKIDTAAGASWAGGSLTLTPTGVEHASGPSLTLSAGPVNWKIGGTPSVKWSSLTTDLVSGNYSHINPANNLSASLSVIGNNNWNLTVGGSYTHTLDAPSASRSHQWNVSVVFRVKF